MVTTLFACQERMDSSLAIEEQGSFITEPHDDERTSTRSRRRNVLAQRIRAVRSEVINALSFLSVVMTLHREEQFSFKYVVFLITGALIILIDCYFIHCQWTLKTNHAIPFRCFLNKTQTPNAASIGALDDLLSDLPQTVWVVCYLTTFKFSLIAMVCTLHSAFSILEGAFRLHD